MAITREFTTEELEALELPWAHTDAWVINERRWSIDKAVVFELDGAFWQIEASFPATEMQEGEDPWDYRTSITAIQVEKRKVLVETWVAV